MQNNSTKATLLTKIVLVLATMPSVFATGAIGPILLPMSQHYSFISRVDLWLRLFTTIPHLVVGILSIPLGFILSKVNRVFALATSTLLFSIFGSLCFLLENTNLLLALRVLLGACSAVTLSTTFTLIADVLDKKDRKAVLSMQVSLMSIGTVTVNLLSGIIADAYGWKFSFLVYLLPSILLPLIIIAFHNIKVAHQSIEENTTIVQKAIQSFRSVIMKGTESTKVFMLCIVSFFGFLNMMMYYLIPLQMPFLLSQLGHTSGKKISVALAMETVFAAIFSFCYAFVSSIKVPVKYIVSAGLGIMSIAFFVISHSGSYAMVVAMSGLYGMGTAFVMPSLHVWLMQSSNKSNRSLVSGFYHAMLYAGKFCASFWIYFITTSLFALYGNKLNMDPSFFAYFISSMALAVFAIGLFILTRGTKNTTDAN